MIKSLERVSPSDYLWRTVEAWVESVRNGLADKELMSFGPEDRLLVDVNRGDLRSVLVWCYYAEDRSARALFGYTWPEFRGMGLYNGLYNRMKTEAKAMGAVKTLGGIMADNKTMLAVARRQGRRMAAYWMEERI